MNEKYVNESIVEEDKKYEYSIEDKLQKEDRKKFNDIFYDIFNEHGDY